MKYISTLFFLAFLIINKSYSNPCQNKDAIIIGDIHGESNVLYNILKKENIITDNGHYNNSTNKCVIQVGDIIDRGKSSIETYLYLQFLRKQSNGRVILLAGNHELSVALNKERLVRMNGGRSWIEDYGLNFFREIIIKDFRKGNLMASYALGDEENPYLITHAGLSSLIHPDIEEECALNLEDIDYDFNDKTDLSKCINMSLQNIDFSFYGLNKKTNISELSKLTVLQNLLISNDGPFLYRGEGQYYEEVNQIKGHDIQPDFKIKVIDNNPSKVYFIDVDISGQLRTRLDNRYEYLYYSSSSNKVQIKETTINLEDRNIYSKDIFTDIKVHLYKKIIQKDFADININDPIFLAHKLFDITIESSMINYSNPHFYDLKVVENKIIYQLNRKYNIDVTPFLRMYRDANYKKDFFIDNIRDGIISPSLGVDLVKLAFVFKLLDIDDINHLTSK